MTSGAPTADRRVSTRIGTIMCRLSVILVIYALASACVATVPDASPEDTLSQYRAWFSRHPSGFTGEIHPVASPLPRRYKAGTSARVILDFASTGGTPGEDFDGVATMEVPLTIAAEGDDLVWSFPHFKVISFDLADLEPAKGWANVKAVDKLGVKYAIRTTGRGVVKDMSIEGKGKGIDRLIEGIPLVPLKVRQLSARAILMTMFGLIPPLPEAPVRAGDVIGRLSWAEVMDLGLENKAVQKKLFGDVEKVLKEQPDMTVTVIGQATVAGREAVITRVDGLIRVDERHEKIEFRVSGFQAIDTDTGLVVEALQRYQTTGETLADGAFKGDQFLHWRTKF